MQNVFASYKNQGIIYIHKIVYWATVKQRKNIYVRITTCIVAFGFQATT